MDFELTETQRLVQKSARERVDVLSAVSLGCQPRKREPGGTTDAFWRISKLSLFAASRQRWRPRAPTLARWGARAALDHAVQRAFVLGEEVIQWGPRSERFTENA